MNRHPNPDGKSISRRFKYVGPGEGRGGIHHVLAQTGENEVSTWSNPSVAGGGFTFFGTLADFWKQFRAL